jgi:hypothetical protein
VGLGLSPVNRAARGVGALSPLRSWGAEEGLGRTCGTAGAGASSFDRSVLGVGGSPVRNRRPGPLGLGLGLVVVRATAARWPDSGFLLLSRFSVMHAILSLHLSFILDFYPVPLALVFTEPAGLEIVGRTTRQVLVLQTVRLIPRHSKRQ